MALLEKIYIPAFGAFSDSDVGCMESIEDIFRRGTESDLDCTGVSRPSERSVAPTNGPLSDLTLNQQSENQSI